MADGKDFVALDLETTGLFPETDRIVELGAVRFDADGRELAQFACLVNPGRRMSAGAQAVHGISDADLVGAPEPAAVLPEFFAFLGEPGSAHLLAHNARFDAAFLGRTRGRLGLPPSGHRIVDTLDLARSRLPDAPDHRLDSLATRLGLGLAGMHRALGDSLRVKDLWLTLRQPGELPDQLAAYPIIDPRPPDAPAPPGWERLAEAMAQGLRVRLCYQGGSRGPAPREVTPRRFLQKEGGSYLVAFCHLELFEKTFRLDRVLAFEVIAAVPASTVLEGAAPEG